MMTRRAEVPAEARRAASARIAAHLVESPAWPPRGPLAVFAAFGTEADPVALEAAADVPIAFPRVEGDRLVFRRAPRGELVTAPPYGIFEPAERHPPVEDIALFVVPGLAFTRDGRRLGYGRGFYDRALAAARAKSPDVRAVAFTFACQLVDDLPTGDLDERVDAVATEDGFFWT